MKMANNQLAYHSSSLKNREQRSIIVRGVIQKYHRLYTSDSFVYMCRNLINSKCFENGLELCSGSNVSGACQQNDVRTKRLLNVIYEPLGKQMLDLLISIGIVPVRFLRDEKETIPYIPIAGTYDVHVVTSPEGICRYELYDDNSGMEPVEDVLIFSGLGYDPRLDGSLTSLMANLEPIMDFTASLHDCAVTAEKVRANPPIVIQRKDTNHSSDANESARFDFYADTDNLKSSMNNQFQRDSVALNALRNQQAKFQQALHGGSQEDANVAHALRNMVPLPSDYNVGTTIEPQARTDFVSVNRMAQETICSTLGVPRSLFINDNVVRSDEQGAHDTLKQTLIWYKQSIAKVLTKVYHHINKEKVVGKLMKRYKKTNPDKRELQGIALETYIGNNMPRIEIPITPYVSNEDLRMLYLQEIITWETYASFMLRNASLPRDLMAGKGDPWKHDDKKELLGVKPEPIATGIPGSAAKKQKTSSSSSGSAK